MQHVSIAYSGKLEEAGIKASVGSVGDSYDNALAETVNGLYKSELIYSQSWKTVSQVELATFEWVYWWNHHRLHQSLGYQSPVEYEASYHQDRASVLTPSSKHQN